MQIVIVIDESGQHPPKCDDGSASGLEVLGALQLAAFQVSTALAQFRGRYGKSVLGYDPSDVPPTTKRS